MELRKSLNFKFGLLLVPIIGLTLISVAQPPTIVWQKCFGGSDADNLLLSNPSENYIYLLGGTLSNNGNILCNHGNNDGWSIRLRQDGSLVDIHCYGGTSDDGVGILYPIDSIDYIMLGSSSSNDGDVSGNHGSLDTWVLKLDSSGVIQNQKCLGGTDYDYLQSFIKYNNTGFLFAGGTTSNNDDVSGNHGGDNSNCGPSQASPCADGWIVATDSSFNILWQKCYGGTRGDALTKVFRTSDNNFLAVGGTESFDGDITNYFGDTIFREPDIWILKFDSTGNILWSKSLGGTGYDEINDVCEDGHGGYLIACSTQSIDGMVSGNHSSSGFSDIWIIRIDSSGNVLWEKCYGGTQEETAAGIIHLFNGHFMVIGSANSSDGDVIGLHNAASFNADVWILELDSSGNLVWNNCYGGSYSEDGLNIIQQSDSSLLFSATGSSNDGDMLGSGFHGFFDAWIVKLTEPTSNYINPLQNRNLFGISANKNYQQLEITTSKNETITVELLDLFGKILVTENLNLHAGSNEWNYSKPLAYGIYFVRCFSTNGTIVKKIVIE